MNMFFRVISAACILCLCAHLLGNNAFSQVREFGDVTVKDFSDYDAKYDSTMPAIILMDYGVASFDNDLNTYLTLHRRMLILQDEGLDYSEIEIPYLIQREQNVDNISAASYTISDDGVIDKSDLEKQHIFVEEFDDDIHIAKFLIPNVKKGSIIEFKYRKRMGGPFLFPDWEFHDYLPVNWSEYRMIIPVGLDYQLILKGSDSLFINESVKILASEVYNNDSGSIAYQLAKRNLPPVEDLPFLINRDDYVTKVITQLREIQLPGYTRQRFFKDWNMIAKELNRREDFGKQKLNGEMKEIVDGLIEGKVSDYEKTKAIYEYLWQVIEWNGFHRILTKKGIRDTFKEKTGNTADINLTLIEMLRHAGIKTSPGLISTRSNGTVITNYSLINQFNMVVAIIEIEEGAFILDATSGLRTITTPHPKLLYRNVFVIREDDSNGWLFVEPMDKNTEQYSLNYSLNSEDEIEIDYSGKLSGEFAAQTRASVDVFNQNAYWENYIDEYESLKVDSTTFDNLLGFQSDVRFDAKLTIPADEIIDKSSDYIYFNPFLFLGMDENPFQRESRDFPVEIAYPYKQQYIVFVEIPDGYEVDEMPESSLVRLPEKQGHYRFMATQNSNIINFMAEVNLTTAYYQPEIYPEVKSMFQEIVNTQAFTVVLKKTVEE